MLHRIGHVETVTVLVEPSGDIAGEWIAHVCSSSTW
jgi:hypothetical protein